jgi:hypothetical protein
VRLLVLSFAACAIIPIGAGSQTARTQIPAENQVQEWLNAVRTHQDGQWDAPAEAIGGWSSADLRVVAEALRPRLRFPDPARMNAVLFAGAMLHTDIAILAPRRRIKSAPGDSLVSLLNDGVDRGQRAREPGWAFARQLLESIAPAARAHPIVKLWYRATTAHMAAFPLLADLPPHLEEAGRLFPDDPDVLFNRGWMYETFASPSIQAAIGGMTTVRSLPDLFDAKDDLKRAEAAYSRVLSIAPGLVEARVRRGRVRSLRGNQKDAVADLEAAVVAAADPFQKYYALLFLGGSYEAIGNNEQARAAYQRAAELFGLAQSPHLALSRLALRRGDMPAAQREVQQVLRLTPTLPTRGDPWWLYYMGSGLHATETLTELRAAIAAARGPS